MEEKKYLNVPYHLHTLVGTEGSVVANALGGSRLSGEGQYCNLTRKYLESMFSAPLVVLTPSCTSALEMALVLMDIKSGDEVIVPSFTFTSTALVVVGRGATPVFVDIDDETLCLDPKKLHQAMSPKTKAIIPVHYAGISADMNRILAIAKSGNIDVIEDAAQAIFATVDGAMIGTKGRMSAFSFHDTKNIHCGEGGALVINDRSLVDRAECVRDKGTNRRKFINGLVDKYTWVEEGSSFLISELQAAMLWAQLQHGQEVTKRRKEIWRRYYDDLRPFDLTGKIRIQRPVENSPGNAHIFYLRLKDEAQRESLRKFLFARGITAITHYQPLHSSPAGQKFGRVGTDMKVTEKVVDGLLRLPLFYSMSDDQVAWVLQSVKDWLKLI